MFYEVKDKLDKDPRFKKYLRENSNWYKYLNRNSSYIKSFEQEMRQRYKLTTKDKVDKLVDSLDTVSQLLDILS